MYNYFKGKLVGYGAINFIIINVIIIIKSIVVSAKLHNQWLSTKGIIT